jgi:hypothetical protein
MISTSTVRQARAVDRDRSSALAALATVAAAVALLLAGGQGAPHAAVAPRGSHAPTHYASPFVRLFPARDVWGQYERTR